jgi:hypothetical protein
MRTWPVLAALVLPLAGCPQLLDSLTGSMPPVDMAIGDGQGDLAGGQPTVSGFVCELVDVRDFRSCARGGASKIRVTIEDTGAYAITDGTGAFLLGLPDATRTHVVVTAVDPQGTLRTTATQVALGPTGVNNFALPMLPSQTELQLTASRGFSSDPSRGTVLAWAVDSSAMPQAGVRGAAVPGAIGPFYDGAGAGEIDDVGPTRSRGLVAYFQVPPGTATVRLDPAATSPVRSDSFDLPVRASALTILLAPLPAR